MKIGDEVYIDIHGDFEKVIISGFRGTLVEFENRALSLKPKFVMTPAEAAKAMMKEGESLIRTANKIEAAL